VIALYSDGTSTLSFTQIIENKTIELFHCPFRIGEEKTVRKHVSFRYKLQQFKH